MIEPPQGKVTAATAFLSRETPRQPFERAITPWTLPRRHRRHGLRTCDERGPAARSGRGLPVLWRDWQGCSLRVPRRGEGAAVQAELRLLPDELRVQAWGRAQVQSQSTTKWSGFGSICASTSYRSVCSTATTPLSLTAAKLGTHLYRRASILIGCLKPLSGARTRKSGTRQGACAPVYGAKQEIYLQETRPSRIISHIGRGADPS